MPISSPRWSLAGLKPQPFVSEWGGPYGNEQVQIPAGKSVEIELAGTLWSLAYVDQTGGGQLLAEVDGRPALRTPTSVPLVAADGRRLLLENRKGTGRFPYGMYVLRITAAEGPVALLGAFAYDTRSNRANDRVLRGTACPGDTVEFTLPFQARPVVLSTGGLRVGSADLGVGQVRFGGTAPGGYEIVGE